MKIYICARNMYSEETEKIARFLEKHGHTVYYSAKDTYQNAPANEMFLNNMVLIRNADVFIIYFTKDAHYGADFAVEVGIAAEAGKPVIGYIDLDERQREIFYTNFEEDVMFSGAFNRLFDDLEEFAKYLLLM
jgi:nucleoside 2-deoxyribosyltransferase